MDGYKDRCANCGKEIILEEGVWDSNHVFVHCSVACLKDRERKYDDYVDPLRAYH